MCLSFLITTDLQTSWPILALISTSSIWGIMFSCCRLSLVQSSSWPIVLHLGHWSTWTVEQARCFSYSWQSAFWPWHLRHKVRKDHRWKKENAFPSFLSDCTGHTYLKPEGKGELSSQDFLTTIWGFGTESARSCWKTSQRWVKVGSIVWLSSSYSRNTKKLKPFVSDGFSTTAITYSLANQTLNEYWGIGLVIVSQHEDIILLLPLSGLFLITTASVTKYPNSHVSTCGPYIRSP